MDSSFAHAGDFFCSVALATQVAAGLLIANASVALHLHFKPFTKPDDNSDQAIVLSVISFSLFSGLLLKTDTASDDQYEISAFAGLLTAVNVIAMVVPPFHLVVALYQKRKRKKRPLYIAPEKKEAVEPNPKETNREHDTNTSLDGESSNGKGEEKAPDAQLPAFDGQEIISSSTSAGMPSQRQPAAMMPPPVVRDNFMFNQSGHRAVRLAPPVVPFVQLVAPPVVPFVQVVAPHVVVPTVPLAAPPAEVPIVQETMSAPPPQQQQQQQQ